MADTPGLSEDEWTRLADWVKAEQAARAEKRKSREQLCKEVDRQIAMLPRAHRVEERRPQWYPNIELPLQFNAFEVIAADVNRLLFPRSGTWFKASADISDDYRNRWDKNRLKKAIIGDVPLEMNLDQETADTLVKVTIEHYHRIYDFKASVGLFTGEALKYGTGIARIRQVRSARFAHDYRGQWSDATLGPAVIPCSFWNTYLDDSWSALLHEGVLLGPTVIRRIGAQPLEDLKRAMAAGPEDGWIKQDVDRLVAKQGPDGKRGTVELLEVEGDVHVPQQSSGAIFLPNVILTVAVGDAAGVIRFRENPMPFRSYIVGHYFRTDLRSAYGESPLMKGSPLQELATEAANDYMAAAKLHVMPPVSYDRNDPTFTAAGGPAIYPGALWGNDAPNAVEAITLGDPVPLLNGLLACIKQYEDTTGVNDARRGARLLSHTTARAADIETSQGISRTENFAADMLAGPLTTMLHMEYEIARQSMAKPQEIRVDAEGMSGWITLAAKDLPEKVEFDPIGSEGVVEEQQRGLAFVAASTHIATVLVPAALQAGVPIPANFEAMARETYVRAGINDTDKFIGPVPTVTGGAAAESAIPGIAQATPTMPGGGQAAPLPPSNGELPGPNGL